jgi:plastocyanin
VFLSLALSSAVLVGACVKTESPTRDAVASEPSPEETFEAPPLPDTVPLADAEKGDLIELPNYPLVGKYTGTKDVTGLESFEIHVPLINTTRGFSPSVLIGSPGQEIEVTVTPDGATNLVPVGSFHDFRISDTPGFSPDHEVVGKQWRAKKGTTFTLTFPEEGSEAFYCRFHVYINMAGLLIVH